MQRFLTMQLIDTHTHIYLPVFDGDRAQVMERAAAAGVTIALLPAIDSTTHAAMLQLEGADARCQAMMGLHPCSVKADFREELAIIRDYLAARRFIAIGEIGLDFYWDKTFAGQQHEAFHEQIALALQYDLPVSIHSRNATTACVEVVRQYPALRGVFHCFSGTEAEARAIMETGLFLGIGGVVTFKNAGLDKVLECVGPDRVVLETDAPYLAPVPYRGKRNEPAYTALVAARLAAIFGRTVAEIGEITTENAKNLFRL